VASARLPSAKPLVIVAIACLAAVGAALVSQHLFDMQPCPWCVLQRLIFVAIALVCLAGAAIPALAGRVGAAALAGLLALCGVAAALWQHFKAAASASCNLTLADKIVSGWLGLDSLWPEVFSARASCADAAVSLLGIPYDFWSLALFAVVGLTLLRGLRSPRRR
jgi:disulfide bond formation protein DsbB